jgi:hypothetical protein
MQGRALAPLPPALSPSCSSSLASRCLQLSATSVLLGDKIALVGGSAVSTFVDEAALVEAVRGLNRLRRLLAWVMQQWAAALADGEVTLPPVSPGFSKDARGNRRKESSSQVADIEPHSSRALDLSDARVIQPTYAAPKLAAVGDVPTGSPPQGDAIPAGLVARYVSMFEDKRHGLDDPSSHPGAPPQGLPARGGDEIKQAAAAMHGRPITIDLSAPFAAKNGSSPIAPQGEHLTSEGIDWPSYLRIVLTGAPPCRRRNESPGQGDRSAVHQAGRSQCCTAAANDNFP